MVVTLRRDGAEDSGGGRRGHQDVSDVGEGRGSVGHRAGSRNF